MTVRTRVSPSTRMATSTHSLLNNDAFPMIPRMQEQREESSPDKEDRLHNTHRKARLQHRASLVNVQFKRVACLLAVLAERAKRNPDAVAGPVSAVCICDEAQLVDAGDECAEEKHVDERDEDCRALGRAEAD